MQTSTSSSKGDSQYGWLWENPEFADVALEIVYAAPLLTSSAPIICPASSTQSVIEQNEHGVNSTVDADAEILSGQSQPNSAAGQKAKTDQPVLALPEGLLIPQEATEQPATGLSSCSHSHVTDGGKSSSEHQSDSASFTRRYLLHSQIISSNSAFLRASLTTTVGAAKRKRGSEDDVCRWQIRAEMAAEDVDAVEAVLQCFYKQHLDDETPGSDLLSVMKVADNWQAPSVAEAASKVLCLRKASFPISAVYTLPDTLKASSFFKEVMAAAEVALLAAFGDTITVIHSKPLLQQFLALPQPAVLALIKSDLLLTDAEETILVLVSSWCDEEVGKACSSKQINQLNQSIRYGCLSRPYLTDLCDVYMSRCAKLTREQLMELWVFTRSSDEDNWPQFDIVNPKDWYIPGRCNSKPYSSGPTIKLEVSEEELRAMLACVNNAEAGDILHESESVYGHGFLWRLSLSVTEGDFSCHISATGVSDIHDLGGLGMELKHGVGCVSAIHIDAAQPFLLFKSHCMLVTTQGVGAGLSGPHCDFEEAAEFDWWEEYIVDGCVRFTATAHPTAPL